MITAAVCAAFDAAGDAGVELLRGRVEAAGHRVRRRHRPHVTLAGVNVDDVEPVVAAMATVAGRFEAFSLTIGELGTFGRDQDILYLAPSESEILHSLQRDVYQSLAPWPRAFGVRSQPHRWVPHCTIATRLPRRTTDRLRRAGVSPFPAVVDALVVIAVGGTGDLARLPLGP